MGLIWTDTETRPFHHEFAQCTLHIECMKMHGVLQCTALLTLKFLQWDLLGNLNGFLECPFFLLHRLEITAQVKWFSTCSQGSAFITETFSFQQLKIGTVQTAPYSWVATLQCHTKCILEHSNTHYVLYTITCPGTQRRPACWYGVPWLGRDERDLLLSACC